MGTSTSSTATTGGATVAKKDFLVDCNGLPLYINMNDTPNSGSSSCTDAACTAEWKPLTMASGKEPMVGQGVDKSLVSTITRDDGTVQVTYNGWPLYLYAADKNPGDQNGVGLDGQWFLIDADGNPIQQ
jgi:predicted lipoprotein with Yx(FWY)xxD motif